MKAKELAQLLLQHPELDVLELFAKLSKQDVNNGDGEEGFVNGWVTFPTCHQPSEAIQPGKAPLDFPAVFGCSCRCAA
jgi:hypothetical protein